MKASSAKKVLLIGWDAADWKAIHPLLDEGKMPNLQKLIEGGVMGNLSTLNPVLSPMLWSSIATGKRPYKHGVYGFSEPDPITGTIRPVTNLSRKTKAFWNILNQEEKKTITVGWWPSNPAEPLSRGVMVSNDFHHAHGNTYEPEKWPMKKGSVHPESWTDKIKQLRFHPAELTEDDLIPFLPGLKGMSQEELDEVAKHPRLQSLAKVIADCTSVHSAATGLMANEEWDMMSVYYDAIDHFGHGFMKFHPPQRKGVSDEDFRLFNYIIEAGYRYHDMMLGTLINMARELDPEVTIMLISDHGFHPDDLRPSQLPNEPAGPAAEHRQLGIFVANGPNIKQDERIDGASLLDICPTILDLFGLPVGQDMDGKVLSQMYQTASTAPEPIQSWDQVDGDHGMHDPDKQISAEDSKAALDQLVALGYIEEPDTDQSKALEQTVRELDYNLAQAWMDGGIYTEAILILERLYAQWPLEHRFGYQLALAYQALNRIDEMKETIATLIQRRLEDAKKAGEELKALKLDNEEVQKAEQERLEKLSDKEKQKFAQERKTLIGRARPNLFALRNLEVKADMADRNYDTALAKLDQLEEDTGERRQTLLMRAQCQAQLTQLDAAEQTYQKVMEIDAEVPAPLVGLGRIALTRKQYAVAADYFQRAVGLVYFQPQTHYFLGLAHYRQGQVDAAEHAFYTAVTQAPLFAAGYRMLADLSKFYRHDPHAYTHYKHQQKIARQEQRKLREDRLVAPSTYTVESTAHTDLPELIFENSTPSSAPDVITIVSGLPRSGTSLMMQMLEAVGIPAYTDNKRVADESNQKGYYEHEAVTQLMQRGGHKGYQWLLEARGKAIKVVAPLLPYLPQKIKDGEETVPLKYRILFMERPISEIVDSQSKMLTRLGKTQPKGDVTQAYHQQVTHALKWINHHTTPTVAINFPHLTQKSEVELEKFTHFLNCKKHASNLNQVIDPSLHRSK